MYNYNIKTSFVSPKIPKGRANKTSFNFIIVHFYICRKTGYNMTRYMIFQYGLEPVLIQWILYGFEAILEDTFSN